MNVSLHGKEGIKAAKQLTLKQELILDPWQWPGGQDQRDEGHCRVLTVDSGWEAKVRGTRVTTGY